jgi:glycosyltransferase involved in cell wall biosynthesis
MASSRPVVSTRVGGIPFQVTSDTGILVDPNDPAALAGALDSLCARPIVRSEMGAAARLRVLDVFNWSNSARRAVEIYQEVIDERLMRKEGDHVKSPSFTSRI